MADRYFHLSYLTFPPPDFISYIHTPQALATEFILPKQNLKLLSYLLLYILEHFRGLATRIPSRFHEYETNSVSTRKMFSLFLFSVRVQEFSKCVYCYPLTDCSNLKCGYLIVAEVLALFIFNDRFLQNSLCLMFYLLIS